ncbi:methyltransferase, TIGR00027 family [Peptoclostridium litorale DSM 5388]|uniref:S-adenosyl-L-methionine-dependent methyltransferase n=1 Tax=Peptoclostridium litorale DSM 5388 TaxID=1121324 RepID=A0A069RBM3_PEPLI|nr:class I SAM-dependent methyltransferase [Peptoclostridium litorale]KDR94158.1 methyltransferase [Peptoclostridium litorale DSM 5388]SIN81612.1 methyltransferase, TIGR00027 family [Peptoclostridium litorale DSM 5388]
MKSTKMAEKNAVVRACEYMLPPEIRLFDDPYSDKFVTSFNQFTIRIMKSKRLYNWIMGLSEKLSPGVNGGIVCRIRYIDDALLKAIEDGFEAVVNLGGGYDTRCLRIENIGKLEYYHIDQPEVIDSFRERMARLSAGVPSNVRFVQIDFNVQSLEEELVRAGYDKTKKTIFIWEGVSQYISEEALVDTFEYIASTNAGNRVVFTYVLKEYLTNPEAFPKYKNIIKLIEKFGIKWINGLSPENMCDYLKANGLNLIEDVGSAEYQERYLTPIGRVMDVMPIERISLAEVI